MKKRANDLVIDPKLVELRPINMYFVSRYRQALRSGSIFPPPIIQSDTNRVISGNHRVTMYLEEYGPDYEIEVIERNFATEADVIRCFAEENSKHGNPLSGLSQKAITQALLKYGDTPETVASALNIPVRKVKNLAGMQVVVIGAKGKKEMRPTKHGIEHVASMKLTEYKEHITYDRGISMRTLASQLERWITNGWVDMQDSGIVDALSSLCNALNRLFEPKSSTEYKA